MLYQEFIDNILNTRGRFAIPKNEYKERHHIIPKCMGGDDSEDNLIDLFGREHVIAHKLLAQENPSNRALTHAYWMMVHCGVNHHECTSEEYEEARIAHAQALSNRVVTQETRDKLSKRLKGQGNPMYGRKGAKSPTYGRKHTKQECQKMSENHVDFTGVKNPKGVKIMCVETQEEFNTIRDASRKYNIGETNISRVCRGIGRTAGGYHWVYVDGQKSVSQNTRKKIICIETQQVYDWWKDVSLQLNVDGQVVAECCKNKNPNRTAYGYHWMYLEDYQRENGDNI